MPIEPFVYLAIFLFLALLTVLGRWLNEKIREEIHLRDLFGPAESPTQPQDLTTPGAPKALTQEAITPSSRPSSLRNRRMRIKTALHNKQDLRQGMVLITVLGPCRALEPPSS
jgi:hypothetical protein